MNFERLCYAGIYHGYLIAVSGGDWEVMCSKRYCMVDGTAADQTEAEAAAKARIDVWADRLRSKEQK